MNENNIGIDISYHQRPNLIDYDELSKNIAFVILRIGYTGNVSGNPTLDAHFLEHYKNFSRRGVPIGVYYFGAAMTKAGGKSEARAVLDWIKKDNIKLDYPIYYDTEISGGNYDHDKLNPQELTKVITAFCSTIEEAGFYVGIYSSPSWFKDRMIYDDLVQYDKWVASWSSSAPTMPSGYGMWQYSSKETFKGYDGPLDANRVYKDYPEIIKRAGLNAQAPNPIYQVYSQVLETDDLEVVNRLKVIFGDRVKIDTKEF